MQARLDDVLEEIVAKLTDKYPPGLCSHHPDLPCFHYRVADLHFKLDRPRLLVWAQAIKVGSATYEKVPILSPMFKMSLALKRPSKNATNAATATATSLASLAGPSVPFANVAQYPQMPFMPPFMNYGMPAPGMPYPPVNVNPFFAAGPGMVSMPTRVSPPSSPTPATTDCTIAEFCERYDLGDQVEAGLERLGFRFGDDLGTIRPEEFADAGFKPLEWRRLLKAYRKLKHENDNN